MAEDNKSVPGPVAGDDLVSKIAKVYRRLPAEPQAHSTEAQSDSENTELDQTFDNLVQMYKAGRAEAENGLAPAPAPRASVQVERQAPAEYKCSRCGHTNPPANQFCGKCGAAREGALVKPPATAVQPQPLGKGLSVSESQIKHLHHHYHHYHYRKLAYVLAALVALLLGVIGWQQGRAHRKVMNAPVPPPPVPSQPAVPAQAQPTPAAAPAVAVPAADVAVPSGEVKPARKPAIRSAKPAPRARPAVAQPTKPANGTAAPILASPPMPKLPEFSHTPPPLPAGRR